MTERRSGGDRRAVPRPTGDRRGGRPRQYDGILSVRLPAALHDELSLEALRRGVDLADVVRERLARGAMPRPA